MQYDAVYKAESICRKINKIQIFENGNIPVSHGFVPSHKFVLGFADDCNKTTIFSYK